MSDKIALTPEAKKISSQAAKLPEHLGFGEVFAPLMLTMRYADGKWGAPQIEPYHSLDLDPACAILHYSQQVFEGMKAHRQPDESVALFRPDKYAERFNNSADRMGIPKVDSAKMVDMLLQYTASIRDWVPKRPGAALYLRPIMFGTDNFLGLRKSFTYLFIIMASPVGSYFKGGVKPIRVAVERHYVRAARGGTGMAKTGGNYSAALKAAVEAKEKGYDQVLWLDAVEMKWVEELGGMNVYFLIDGTLGTSPLTGTILPGITRMSILEIARSLGIKAGEKRISIDELLGKIESGACAEAFACGTAAVITPLGALVDNGKEHVINNGKAGETTMNLYNALTDIQYGRRPAPEGWLFRV